MHINHDELTKGLDFVNNATGTACTDNKVAVKVAFTNATDAGKSTNRSNT